MTLYNIIGLATAILILAVTPGPGVFVTISKALGSGFKHAIPVIIGIVIGDLIFLLFAIFGLSIIANSFNYLFGMIKFLGGIYLIWLGIILWKSTPIIMDKTKSEALSHKISFLSGLSITLGNPKVILFYLGFLPTFLKLDKLANVDIIIVCFIISFILASVMLFYAYAASQARQLFSSEKATKHINRTAGSVMIGTGAVLLVKT